MLRTKPKVLIFDDKEWWAKQIANTIRLTYDTTTTTTIDYWRKEASSAYWDVIVMDVKILGTQTTGTHHAEQAILEYGITSPIIVISGVSSHDEMEREHPGIFFDYVHKDDLGSRLPESVDRACTIGARTDHVRRMTTAFARKFRILRVGFSTDLLQGKVLKQLFESAGGTTVADLIGLIEGATKQQIDYMGKNVLMVIDAIRAKPT